MNKERIIEHNKNLNTLIYTAINKEIFRKVMHEKKWSIRRCEREYICSEKTIRNALKTSRIKKSLLTTLSQKMDVDVKYLTGEVFENEFEIVSEKNIQLYIEKIKYYPYERGSFDKLKDSPLSEIENQIVTMLDIEYNQFSDLLPSQKKGLLIDFLNTIKSIRYRYFSDDDEYYLNNKSKHDYFISEIEEYYDFEEPELVYADKKIRTDFLNNPPIGYTKYKITSMTRKEILQLSYNLKGNADK